MSWNCQGVGRSHNLTILRLVEIRKRYFPEMLFLMETKKSRNKMVDLHEWVGYDMVVIVEPVGYSGGLTLMWKKKVDVDIMYNDKNLIGCHVKLSNLSFYVSFIYGDPVIKDRAKVWGRITRINILKLSSWCFLGDFNDNIHCGEKVGGPIKNDSICESFLNMIK